MTGTNEVFNTLLNLDQCGWRRRDEGKALAAERRAHTLEHAQGVATFLAADDAAEDQRGITIDDVRNHMLYEGDSPNDLGNAAGSVFSGKGWRRVGSVQSTRPSSHARWIGVWQYDPEGSTDVTEAPGDSTHFVTEHGAVLFNGSSPVQNYEETRLLCLFATEDDTSTSLQQYGVDKLSAEAIEYWHRRCVLQEQALDACLVATVGPQRGDPDVEVDIDQGVSTDAVLGDVGWRLSETKHLIQKALDARRMKT